MDFCLCPIKLDKNTKLAETLLGTDYLQERYDYLNEEGFQVSHGSVRELLKLKAMLKVKVDLRHKK